MKRFFAVLTVLLLAVLLCCSVCFAADGFEEEMDAEALRLALGFTEEQMEQLANEELDFNEVDLSKVDLGALVEAMGSSEEELKEMVFEETGMDLGDFRLSEVDLGRLVDALGLTGDDLNRISRGEMDPEELELGEVNVSAVMDAVGISAADLLPMVMGAMGLNTVYQDAAKLGFMAAGGAVRGILISVAVVTVVTVVLLIIDSRKKTASSRRSGEA